MKFKYIKKLRKVANTLYQEFEKPLFYIERQSEISRSEREASVSEHVNLIKLIVKDRGNVFGHDYMHAHKVAIESGAIIYSEIGDGDRSNHLAINALISGYLHDIRRDMQNHPEMGAEEARAILHNKLPEDDIDMIAFAIKNHEAFKEYETVKDEDFMLLSNALYDSDKFRWGPDNFTDTIWNIAESIKLSPEHMIKGYESGMEAISKIKKTFRSETGRKYGPNFIDIGLKIGEEMLRYLSNSEL